MKIKKIVCLILVLISTNFATGCSNKNIKQLDLKEKINEFINKKSKNTEEDKTVKTIADSIKINIDNYEIKNDYENKPTIILKITYKNLSKDVKRLDSDDTILHQGKYKLKSTYDMGLNTEAFFEEINPNESKTFILGYRVEGDSDFILKFTPFLSKEEVKLEIKYPKNKK